MSAILTDEQMNQFQEEGFCIVKNVIPKELIERLKDECQRFIKEKDDEMDRKGVEVDEMP